MPKTKNFKRHEVLKKAIPLFWKKGYAETTITDLERVTGVNKSGLYSEFRNKEDIFLQSLSHFLDRRAEHDLLKREPRGWANVENFLQLATYNTRELKGCFMVYAMRDFQILSSEGQEFIAAKRAYIKEQVRENIVAENTVAPAGEIAETVILFFSGMALNQTIKPKDYAGESAITNLMKLLKSL